MAFDQKYLSVLSVGNSAASSPRLWAYDGSATGGNDTITDIGAANFFRSYASGVTSGGLRVGDVVIARGNNGSVISCITAISSTTSTQVKATLA